MSAGQRYQPPNRRFSLSPSLPLSLCLPPLTHHLTVVVVVVSAQSRGDVRPVKTERRGGVVHRRRKGVCGCQPTTGK
ncbi:hypothetical protein HanRHA438_Chr11g0519231 [Helianthus annuus]|nr:hypothetical protein HanRHA438_Chr11g0519231 [Helianthus annuus]